MPIKDLRARQVRRDRTQNATFPLPCDDFNKKIESYILGLRNPLQRLQYFLGIDRGVSMLALTQNFVQWCHRSYAMDHGGCQALRVEVGESVEKIFRHFTDD